MKVKAFFGMLVLGFSGFAWTQPTPIAQPIAGRLSSPIVSPKVITPEIINPGITFPGRLNPNASCPDTALEADVVAIDHPIVFNRLGAQNVNWMLYALRHDVIDLKTSKTFDYTSEGNSLFESAKKRNSSREIALRPDLRPRPLVLRVAAGDYLKVRFTNLLQVKSGPHPQTGDPFSNQANPFDSYPDPLPNIDHPMEHAKKDAPGTLDTVCAIRS